MKIKEALLWARAELKQSEEGQNDALFLLAAVRGENKAWLIAFEEEDLTPKQWLKFQQYIKERKQYKPVSQILGTQPFWRWEFEVSSDVLTPRADSEVLIEAVLADFKEKNKVYKIADFGTGSGCLLLSTLGEYNKALGYGLDISEKALKIAYQNEEYLKEQGALFSKVKWILGSWSDLGVYKKFDIILANPPYIARTEEKSLAKDVVDYEPHKALFADNDGLKAYEELFPLFKEYLSEKGRAYVEHGYKQQEKVISIAKKAELKIVRKIKDLSHHPRGVVLAKN